MKDTITKQRRDAATHGGTELAKGLPVRTNAYGGSQNLEALNFRGKKKELPGPLISPAYSVRNGEAMKHEQLRIAGTGACFIFLLKQNILSAERPFWG